MDVVSALLAAAAVVLALSRPRPLSRPRTSTLPAAPSPPAPGTWDAPEDVGVHRSLLLRLVATVGAATAVLLLVPGVPGVLVAATAGGAVWWRSGSWESAAARRRRALLAADLPHVVDLMVATLAAGAAPGEALARVVSVTGAPTDEELRIWLSRLRLGADPVTVWSSMARHPELGRLGAALQRSAESGAPVVEALSRLATELRAAYRAEVEARVRQVEVKAAVPLAVCLLPAFVLTGVVPLVAGSVSGLLLGG
jgi:Flp pilus assembly protein TadB